MGRQTAGTQAQSAKNLKCRCKCVFVGVVEARKGGEWCSDVVCLCSIELEFVWWRSPTWQPQSSAPRLVGGLEVVAEQLQNIMTV